MLVSPFRNHSSSWMMDLRCTFLVVSSGNPALRSKRSCAPKTESVPVPVRSFLRAPCSSTWRIRSRYWRIVTASRPGAPVLLFDFERVGLLQHPLRDRVHRVCFAAEKAVWAHRLAGLRLRWRAAGDRNERVAVCEPLCRMMGRVLAAVVHVVSEKQRRRYRRK